MNPKILLASVTYDGKDYCLDEFIDSIKNIDYPNYEILIADNSKDPNHINKFKGIKTIKTKHFDNPKDSLVDSRNILRDYFLKNNFDYFFSVDSDIILPKNSIKKLLEPRKDIISGVYYNKFKKNNKEMIYPIIYQRMSKFELNIMKKNINILPKKIIDELNNKEPILHKQLTQEQVQGDKLIEIHLTGHGCLLIKRDIIKKIPFRYKSAFDDSMFCIDAIKQGYKIYARTGVKCIHIPSNNWEKILPKQ